MYIKVLLTMLAPVLLGIVMVLFDTLSSVLVRIVMVLFDTLFYSPFSSKYYKHGEGLVLDVGAFMKAIEVKYGKSGQEKDKL